MIGHLLSVRARPGPLASVLLIVMTVLVIGPSPAAAHTGFESSSPADGESVNTPVSTVSITFSGAAEPAGEGFVVLDGSGEIRTPDEVASVDNLTWTLTFSEPLAGGTIGVRWRVAAPDAHPIEGSFSFTVTAAAPTTSTTTQAAAPSATTPATASSTSESLAPDNSEAEAPIDGASVEDPPAPTSNDALDDFLATKDAASAAGASWLARLGRILALVGAMLGIGGLVFVAYVLQGEPADIHSVLFWGRRSGAMLIVGSIIEAVTQVAVVGGGWASLWSPSAIADVIASSFGIAITLRLVGGVVLTGADWLKLGIAAKASGAVVVLASYLFDGHTVTEGPRWLHSVVNVGHVSAGAIWVGGVVMLASVIWRRHRHGVEVGAEHLAVRFSVVAAAALTVAGLGGTALAVIILDSPSGLWSTPWGRLLIGKIVLVSIAACAGAYNHYALLPGLRHSPDDERLEHRFRTVVAGEAATLLAVIAITGVLVAAASR